MKLRDTRKDSLYFDKYISEQNKRIVKFESIKKQLDDKNKIKQCNRVLANFFRDLFSAKYSSGENIEELKKCFDIYIELLSEVDDISYDEYIDALSIDVLLNSNKKDNINKLNHRFKEDVLAAILIGEKSGSSEIRYPDYYDSFYLFLTDNISLNDFIQFMNDEWYKKNTEMSWYDSLNSNQETYVGYWCWLAGACVKIKGYQNCNCEYIPCVE